MLAVAAAVARTATGGAAPTPRRRGMKLNDAVWGALLLLLAAAVLVHVQSFRHDSGPASRPGALPGPRRRAASRSARVLLICNGLAARTRDGGASAWMTLAPWTRSRRHVFAFALTDRRQRLLHPRSSTGSASSRRASSTSSVLFAVFGVRPAWILPIALVLTLVDPLRVLQAAQGPAALGPAAGLHLVARDGDVTMSGAWAQAFALVFDPYNIVVMLAASLFGLFVGAMPGLTATMATALLVPVTFFMAPIPAIAAIVTATAMAIFSGDIPGCLLRMPGTPASAAYTDEAYAMTQQGPGRARAGRGPRVLGDRRAVRNGRADRRGADARRVRAQVQLVRVFLARAAGPDLRGLHDVGAPAQGLRLAVPRAADRERRPQQSGGHSRASRSAASS